MRIIQNKTILWSTIFVWAKCSSFTDHNYVTNIIEAEKTMESLKNVAKTNIHTIYTNTLYAQTSQLNNI